MKNGRIVKKKKCKECDAEFTPFKTTDRVCSYKCFLLSKKSKKKEEKNMSKMLFMQAATIVCNKYVRLRDQGKPCISCGKKWNGKFQAGHMFSAGGNSNIMFDEKNIHGQCVECNAGSCFDMNSYVREFKVRYSEQEYENLKKKAHIIKRWEVDELKEIIEHYKKKIHELVNWEKMQEFKK